MSSSAPLHRLQTISNCFSIACAILLLGSTVAKAQGWKDAKWGMTVAQIQKLYPRATQTVDKGLGLENYDYQGGVYNVAFAFDGQGGLREVTLSRLFEQESVVKSNAEKLRALLVHEYGMPALSQETELGGFRLIWNTPDLKLLLRLIAFPGQSNFLLATSYEKPKAEDVAKF
jgi:hypothetical protein